MQLAHPRQRENLGGVRNIARPWKTSAYLDIRSGNAPTKNRGDRTVPLRPSKHGGLEVEDHLRGILRGVYECVPTV